MTKINFQTEFINKFDIENSHPLKMEGSGYCLYYKNTSITFSDFFNAPSQQYKQYLLDVQYYANYYKSSIKDDVTFRLENLFNYIQVNKTAPNIVSFNGYPSNNIIKYIDEFKNFNLRNSYTFAYFMKDQINEVDSSQLNEVRYLYESNNEYIMNDFNIFVLEVPLLSTYNKGNIAELNDLFDKFDHIIFRDIEVNSNNIESLPNTDIYKNLAWYISSYKILDILLTTFFSKKRNSSLFYWSSDVDRLLNNNYEGQIEFNFLKTNDIFMRGKNI